MHIALFFLSLIIAITFILVSEKTKVNWVKKTFVTYGILFTVSAIAVGSIYINENKATFKHVVTYLIDHREVQQTEPIRALISEYKIKGAIRLEAPLVEQLPELPRGCEVSTLAMLLQYHDINIGKMELAEKVKKDPTRYETTDKGTHFGNPYNGFVGDMYSFENPGLGVYHKPIAELASKYVDERVHDFTGESFTKIFDQLNEGRPVWVIINATYKKLSKSHFKTWHTIDGPLEVTMKEHSVLITGYDHDYIYFNDPLNRDEKAPIEDFKEAWVQMGKQAITVF